MGVFSKIILTSGLVLASFAPALSAQAQGSGKAYGFDDINQMCKGVKNLPKPNMQFDGKPVDKRVMKMKAGKYSYPNNGGVLLFLNDNYLIKLPKSDGPRTIYGTDGDDLLAKGGIVGGCFREQLSEALRRNKMDFDKLELVKEYK